MKHPQRHIATTLPDARADLPHGAPARCLCGQAGRMDHTRSSEYHDGIWIAAGRPVCGLCYDN